MIKILLVDDNAPHRQAAAKLDVLGFVGKADFVLALAGLMLGRQMAHHPQRASNSVANRITRGPGWRASLRAI